MTILGPGLPGLVVLVVVQHGVGTKMAKKLELVENKIRDIFIQCLVFNKTIIPLTLVGHELMIAISVLCTSSTI